MTLWAAVLGCVPPDREMKVGATLVGLLLESVSVVWSFTSFALEALPRDTWDGISIGSTTVVTTLLKARLCCAVRVRGELVVSRKS